jgi:DNA-binding LytR/AlgR family response regulator
MRVDFLEDKDAYDTRVIIQAPERSQDVEELIEAIMSFSPSPISGYSEGVMTRIVKDSIIRIYSKDKKVYADTTDGSFLIKSPLYQLEGELPRKFVRISNSEIVNSDRIIRLDLNLAGTIRIFLEGDIESHVSRRYVSKVKEALI